MAAAFLFLRTPPTHPPTHQHPLSHPLLPPHTPPLHTHPKYKPGLTARRLRLPQITGYLVSGIICGPYCLGILSTESVSDLSIIEGACLGIIGLAAGAELQLAELNRSKKQVCDGVLSCVFE